jgi:acyl-CoA reductase-like NAD-dependent aldehyde dehydrogenase
VVGLISPWNFPLLMAVWKIAPAVAAGNCVVLKPSEITPLTQLFLGQLIVEAGFPPGVINIIPGYGDQAGDAISHHPRIGKVSFTGSTRVGRLIQQASSNTNLKKVSLELGGKSPVLIFADANLDKSLEEVFLGAFWNSGQCCNCGSRIFVQDTIYEKFLELYKARVL